MAKMRRRPEGGMAAPQSNSAAESGNLMALRPGMTVGVGQRPDPMDPQFQALSLMGGRLPMAWKIGKREIQEAASILTRYKDGKANLENQLVENEIWYTLRHWEIIRRKHDKTSPDPTSAWLFNTILNKHADAMDNFPEVTVLPRERSDEESSKILSKIMPVIMENNGFDDTYADQWWEKLKHGTGVYGVFWNPEMENGLGDIEIKGIDLLKIFWEPGITDVQKSRNLFIVELVDEDILDEMYPQYKGRLRGATIDVKQYLYDETIDTSGKSVVVDWYYKVRTSSGRTVLHYAKFVGDVLLFASENETAEDGSQKYPNGWYEHGKYPVVFDKMFPEKGMPTGFGYVTVCKDPQLYVDQLDGNILENAMQITKRRWFISEGCEVNEEELSDWSKPFVHVQGTIDDNHIRQIPVNPMPTHVLQIAQMKIDEMKETAANRDASSGGVSGGVTAASAIAALQEAGNKVSRDMISTSYRSYVAVATMIVELMRQFYDEARSFRITGDMPGSYDFVDFSNAAIQDQPMQTAGGIEQMFRKPVFDIKISAQKKNPFSRMEQNERAKELYGLGFFDPERAQPASISLEMMDFEGIDKIREKVNEGQTLLNLLQQMNSQMDAMAALLQTLTGYQMPQMGGAPAQQPAPQQNGGDGRTQAQTRVDGAQTAMTGYGQRLAQRSTPHVENSSNAARPKA